MKFKTIKSFLLIIAPIIVAFCFTCEAFPKTELFPPQIKNPADNKLEPGKTDETDENEKKNVRKVAYQVSGKKVEAFVVYPPDTPRQDLPAVLFIHTADETPADQLKRMKFLAKKGYLVFCAPWENHVDISIAYEKLKSMEEVDYTSIGILGVHQGATEAMLFACKKRREVKALVSIAGRPPELPEGELADILWAPSLFIHGQLDSQVPYTVSQFLYYSLVSRERKSSFFLMPHSRHYFNDTEWERILSEAGKFFDRYVRLISPDEED